MIGNLLGMVRALLLRDHRSLSADRTVFIVRALHSSPQLATPAVADLARRFTSRRSLSPVFVFLRESATPASMSSKTHTYVRAVGCQPTGAVELAVRPSSRLLRQPTTRPVN